MSLIQPVRRRPSAHSLEVSAVDRLTADAVAVRLRVPEGLAEVFAFQAGQHLTLRREIGGQDVRRSYSLCLSPRQARESGELRIAAARVRGGLMSGWLVDEVAPGDAVLVLPPMGEMVCPTDPAAQRHHVGICAGSGITPVLSLLVTALEEEPGSRATLLLGSRTRASAMFAEELDALAATHPERFTWINVTSQEARGEPLLSGRLDHDRLEALLTGGLDLAEVDEWYLCGPSGLVDTARLLLLDRGVGEHHLHHEVFHVDD